MKIVRAAWQSGRASSGLVIVASLPWRAETSAVLNTAAPAGTTRITFVQRGQDIADLEARHQQIGDALAAAQRRAPTITINLSAHRSEMTWLGALDWYSSDPRDTYLDQALKDTVVEIPRLTSGYALETEQLEKTGQLAFRNARANLQARIDDVFAGGARA